MVRSVSLLVCVSTAACVNKTGSLFDMTVTPQPTAVGAIAGGQLASRSCSGSDCDFHDVEILSLSVSPEGIFDTPTVGPAPSQFKIPALAEGTVTFTATGNDGDQTSTFTRELIAVAPDRVRGALEGDDGECPQPALFGPQTLAKIPYEVLREDEVLFANGFLPFAVEGATIFESGSSAGTLVLDLPASPAQVTVTSPLDPSFSVSLEVIAPTRIDGLELSDPDGVLRPLGKVNVGIALFAGGQPVCEDDLSRQITSVTPTTCRIDGSYFNGAYTFEVTGVAAGMCTVEVELGASSLTATKTFFVTM